MKYSIRCNLLTSQPRADGTCPIRMRVSWAGARVSFNLVAGISQSEWDNTAGAPRKPRQRGKIGTYDDAAARAVREIGERTAEIDRFFDSCHLDQRVPTVEEVRDVVERRRVEVGPLLTDAARRYMDANRDKWAGNTARNYRTLLYSLVRWDAKATTSSMDTERVGEFVANLYRSGLQNSSVMKQHRQLISILRWAKSQGIAVGEFDAKAPSYRTIVQEPIYLTREEISAIRALDLTDNPRLDHIRDCFLFQCFSGLRYSDISKLRWSDIHDGAIHIVTQKTTDQLTIELNATTAAILEKYSDNSDISDISSNAAKHAANASKHASYFAEMSAYASRRAVLPCPSNADYNRYLKELGQLAHLDTPIRRIAMVKAERREVIVPKWQLLTTHVARKTFVVTGLSLGIPAEVIMKWTGHTDYDSMKPYIAIVDRLKASSMSKFDTMTETMTEK